jgi:hypothetical protein
MDMVSDMSSLRKIYDPYKTIKHVSYREMRARYKREQAWADKFTRIIFTLMAIGVFLVIALSNLVHVAP